MLNFRFSFLCVFFVVFLCSCNKEIQQSKVIKTKTYTNERIVSLAPSFTQVLYGLGLEKNLVGIAGDTYTSSNITQLGLFSPVKDEKESELRKKQCLSLEPTMILGHDYMFTLETTKSLGNVFYNVNERISDVADLARFIRLLSILTKRREEGEKLVEYIEWGLLETRLHLKDIVSKRYLILLNYEPLQILGHGAFLSSTLELYNLGINMSPSASLVVEIVQDDISLLVPEIVIDLTNEQQMPINLEKYLKENKIHVEKGRAQWLVPGPSVVPSVKEIVKILYSRK